jgi:hypothetical protein
MCSKTATKTLPRAGRTLLASLRQFLTPQVWKQGHQACASSRRGKPRRKQRWDLQPLVLVLLTMTWCCGDSQAERFETGKAFCAVSLTKRRRPGETREGFHKALAKLPTVVLRQLAHAVRQRILTLWGDDGLQVRGFVPLGVDGSRVECPRTQELEQRLGQAGKKDSAPTVWVTALVHLRLGLLWAWRLGKGTASERDHLRQMLATLPKAALVVADAGFNGFDLAQAMVAVRASFLIRMSAKVRLLTERQPQPGRWYDGEGIYWPEQAQAKHQKPMRVRLIRVRAKKKKNDVWLLTNILDRQRLPRDLAAQFYRWRWENEGLFRTYKRTLAKVKLMNRTVALVHREAEGSLLATQLLLAQGACALRTQACSPRQVLLAIREEIARNQGPRQRVRFDKRLAQAKREHRQRRSAKVKRHWPRRGPHKPPKPPRFLMLTKQQRARISQLESDAA